MVLVFFSAELLFLKAFYFSPNLFGKFSHEKLFGYVQKLVLL